MNRILLAFACLCLALPLQAQDTVLARNAWTTVTKSDFLAEIARIPKEQRPGYLASAQRVAATVEAILVTKTLAARARAAKADADPAVKAEMALAAEKVLARVMQERHEAGLRFPDFDKRAEELYKASSGRYAEKNVIHTRHVLIDTKCRTVEAATARALEARAELASGKPFEEVARKYSDDPTVGRNGGDLGPLAEDSLVPAFVEAARKLKPGELSAPVQTQFGVHIVRLDALKPGRAFPFRDVKASIVAELQEDWLKEQRKAYVDAITADPGLKLELDAIQSLKTNVDATIPPPPRRPG